jgi:hypothetical protein
MGWSFELSIEFGGDANASGLAQRHFNDQPVVLDDGNDALFKADCATIDEYERWWLSVVVLIKGKPLQASDNAAMLTMASRKLYERLKLFSGYRFAIVGIETFQFNSLESLPKLLGNPALAGLVVSKEVYQSIGLPAGFQPFSNGYLWLPSDGSFR